MAAQDELAHLGTVAQPDHDQRRVHVAPFGFGIIKEQTGSVIPGLFALAAASALAAGLVYFLKERRAGGGSAVNDGPLDEAEDRPAPAQGTIPSRA